MVICERYFIIKKKKQLDTVYLLQTKEHRSLQITKSVNSEVIFYIFIYYLFVLNRLLGVRKID